MDILVVAGFLGAGKTTTVGELLRLAAARGERTAVLVNDFGRVGIDQLTLAATGVPVRALPAGCVCCTLRGDLGRALEELATTARPDRLLLEPSGVASPAALLEVLAQVAKDLGRVDLLSVVDASRYGKLPPFQALVEEGVSAAGAVVLNKADRCSAEELEEVRGAVRRLNARAPVFTAVRGRIPWPKFAPAAGAPPTAAPEVEEWTWEGTGLQDLERVRRVFDRLAAGEWGAVLRAKGVFATSQGGRRLEWAGGAWEEHAVAADGSWLAVLGRNLRKEELAACLASVGRRG